MTKNKLLNIFISYSSDKHTDFAVKIKDDLKTRGQKIWFDKKSLK